MRVMDWMTPHPFTVPPGASTLTARRVLTGRHIRHLPVVCGDRVVGILSERDLVIHDPEIRDGLARLQSDLPSTGSVRSQW